MYSEEIKDQFAELRAEGHSLRAISEKINVPRSTLADWNEEYATYVHHEHRKALEDRLGALAAAKIDRVEALAFCFKKIEARARKSKDPVKDARLFELLLKYDQYMNSELLTEGNPVTPEEAKEFKPPLEVTTAIPRPWDKCTCNTGPVERCWYHGEQARERKEEQKLELEEKREMLRQLEEELGDDSED